MKLSFTFFLLLVSVHSMSQQFPGSSSEWRRALENYEASNHDDRLYISTNGNYFVSGELLQFSVFCISRNSQQIATLSRVAYIALVDAEQKPVMETKVLLTQGRGYGDVFLSSSLPSGIYTLVGYTGLQKSQNRKDIFQMAITLINPFGKGVAEAPESKAEVKAANTAPVLGVLNSFVLKDPAGLHLGTTARILNNAGDILASFQIEQPRQTFSYIPTGNNRLVLTTSQGTNTFLALPKAMNQGIVIDVSDNEEGYTAIFRSPQALKADIVIRCNAQFIAHQTVTLSKDFTMPLAARDLPEGPVSVEVWQSGKLLEKTTFAHSQPNSTLHVATDAAQYGPRQKVQFTLSSQVKSTVSVVVRSTFHMCKGEESIHERLVADASSYSLVTPRALDQMDRSYPLTDVHGDILSGVVVDENGDPLLNAPVFVSEASSNFHLLTGLTDQEGRFHIVAPPSIQSNTLFAQSSVPRSTIRFDDEWFLSYPQVNRRQFQISKDDLPLIEEKSLYSQIENAYYLSKAQTKLPLVNRTFFGAASKSYDLADYTRFSTLEETFREIIPGITVSRIGPDFDLAILDPQSKLSNGNTLILLDGLPIQNINDLMAMDALDIRRVEFVREEYFYGPLMLSGIISLQTTEGNLRGFKVVDEVVEHSYTPVQPSKEYHQPSYPSPENDRIPDYRTVLYWEPIAEVNESRSIESSFFTSDVPGTYEVVVEGFDEQGNALLATMKFTVN